MGRGCCIQSDWLLSSRRGAALGQAAHPRSAAEASAARPETAGPSRWACECRIRIPGSCRKVPLLLRLYIFYKYIKMRACGLPDSGAALYEIRIPGSDRNAPLLLRPYIFYKYIKIYKTI
jgi:hypothetical protein